MRHSLLNSVLFRNENVMYSINMPPTFMTEILALLKLKMLHIHEFHKISNDV